MATYASAYAHLGRKEGGWIEHPNETAFGVDRKHHPKWIGWAKVDEAKKRLPPGISQKGIRKLMTSMLKEDQTFQGMLFVFFRQNFWSANYNRLDDQRTANYIFDKAVVCGAKQAHKIVQRSLGFQGRAVDGLFGSQSVMACNRISWDVFFKMVDPNFDQFFHHLADDNPEMEQYEQGWVAR